MNAFSKRTLLQKTVISYMIVLIIPLVFGVSLYLTTLNVYRKDVDESNLQILNNVRDTVHVNLTGISSVMRTLFSESEVISLAGKAHYESADYTQMSELQHTLSLSLLSNSYIDEILLYFHKTDLLLTSRNSVEHISDIPGYSSTIGLDIPAFSRQLGRRESYYLRIFPTKHGSRVFMTAYPQSVHSPNITILVRLKGELLAKIMQSEECSTFLVDDDGNFIGTDQSSVSLRGGEWLLNGSPSDSRCIYTGDPVFHITHVRFIPSDIYSRNLSVLQYLAAVFLIMCLLLGIPVSFFIAKRSYDPIRDILALIPDSPDGQNSDDYKIIRTSIINLLQKNRAHEKELTDRRAVMHDYLFFQLLALPDMKEKTFLRECRKCEVSLNLDSFLLLGFLIENGSNLFFEPDETANEEMSDLLQVAISNILRSELGREYHLFDAEYKGNYYLLISIDPRLDKDIAAEEIKLACHELSVRLDANFRAIVSVAISSVHSGHSSVRRCYEEIKQIVQRERTNRHTAYIIHYHEISPEDDGASPAPDPAARLIPVRKECEKHSSADEICAYISEHYTDPELTVGTLSEHFNMTTANFSLYFKRKTGLSPLEYIQLERVQQAKHLLETTPMLISDIAKRVGYYDTRPLIRAFKRTEGMTPAEYRESLSPKGTEGSDI